MAIALHVNRIEKRDLRTAKTPRELVKVSKLIKAKVVSVPFSEDASFAATPRSGPIFRLKGVSKHIHMRSQPTTKMRRCDAELIVGLLRRRSYPAVFISTNRRLGKLRCAGPMEICRDARLFLYLPMTRLNKFYQLYAWRYLAAFLDLRGCRLLMQGALPSLMPTFGRQL